MTKPFTFVLNLIWLALLSSLLLITDARAHEVQPTVMRFSLNGEQIEIKAEWMIETAVAGLDLAELQNTTEAEDDGEYDRLRALGPAELETAIRDAWPAIAAKFRFRAGDTPLTLELGDMTIPEAGNVELARVSELNLSATLPPGTDPLTFGWDSDLGVLILREESGNAEFAQFLTPGATSNPVPRSGGEAQGPIAAFVDYITVGFDHIVPQGLDHILFVLGLFFLSLRMGPLLWQVTAFTLAHTVTLALGAFDIIRLSGDIVEPLIAASIVYVGIENLFARKLNPWRPVIVFCFGLLHGLGFAAVLQEFGLGNDNFVAKLIGFNVGVEIGQLAVIAAAWVTLALFFGRYEWYHRRIAAPVSIAIAAIAAFWVLERTGTISVDGPWSLFSNLTEGGFDPIQVALVALGVAALLTVIEMVLATSDTLRDVCGFLTSLVLFIGITAAFTSGAWLISIGLAAAWVLALRLQSLGEPAIGAST